MLKSLISALTHTQNAPVKLRRRYQMKFFFLGRATYNILGVIFENIGSKLEKIGPIFFNPFPSLPSVATDDRKQFQCGKKVFNNKTEPLFLEFK